MTFHRSARGARHSIWVAATVLGLFAPLLALAPAQAQLPARAEGDSPAYVTPMRAPGAAQAREANPDGCKTIVREFDKVSGKIKLRYELWCARAQGTLKVVGRITNRTNGDIVKNDKQCDSTYFCQVTVTYNDPAGPTDYFGDGSTCFGQVGRCATIAIAYDGDITDASEMRPCDEPCHDGGLVVRSRFDL